MRFFVILSFLLLLSLISYCVKWPFSWQGGGLLKRYRHKHGELEQRVAEGDTILLQVADVIIELRTNAERLETVLKQLKDENEPL